MCVLINIITYSDVRSLKISDDVFDAMFLLLVLLFHFSFLFVNNEKHKG